MENKWGSINNNQNSRRNSAFSSLQAKENANMWVKIPKRQAAQKSSILGYNEWEICRKIESQEYLLQCKRTKGNENSTIIKQEEEKLRRLRKHVCNNEVNSDWYNDEEFNINLDSKNNKIRKWIRK